jgi:predicted SprT family Zn-dependent metalloprotease
MLIASISPTPTYQTYAELQQAYEHFNAALFGNVLPSCLITLQREKQTFGYFSRNRFANHDGQFVDEIALNPAYFAVVPLVETMQTLVHEMAHLWQHHFGKPGRGRYHNEEWATKMEAIGLMPSHNGQPGGKRLGDHMADYAMPHGQFLAACQKLITQSYRLSWYDRFPSIEQIKTGQNSHSMQLASDVGGGMTGLETEHIKASLVVQTPKVKLVSDDQSNRSKFRCPECRCQAWGKPSLRLVCGDCAMAMKPVSEATVDA